MQTASGTYSVFKANARLQMSIMKYEVKRGTVELNYFRHVLFPMEVLCELFTGGRRKRT